MEIKFDENQLKIINIDEVRPNTWNPKDKDTKEYQIIKQSLNKKGLRLPVVVRENNGYEIIDGEQRWTAWKELGHKTILIYNEGKISDQEAKELTIWYEQKVPFNEIDLAKLVTEMNLEYKDLELPYTKLELDEMKELTDFDWDKYEDNYEEEQEKDFKTLSLNCTDEQYKIIMDAINKVKKQINDMDISNNRALELICGDYLAGK
jgi:hypothetical protein